MGIFHRYKSEIHGNYRRAYLRCGLATGLLLGVYVLVRYLMGKPVENPESMVMDGVMLIAVLVTGIAYRKSLPEGKVTLKEMMLFGIGLAVVASVVYGLMLWGIGVVFKEQTVVFTRVLAGQEIGVDDEQLGYWALWWALLTAVKMAIVGGLGAFLTAILLKNEKSDIKRS